MAAPHESEYLFNSIEKFAMSLSNSFTIDLIAIFTLALVTFSLVNTLEPAVAKPAALSNCFASSGLERETIFEVIE